MAAYLADALYQQGRADEAEALTRFVEENAAADDYIPQFTWRTVRGKVLAGRGELETAEALVREAMAIVRTTDDIDAQADTLMDLAEVLVDAGRAADAQAFAQEALDLYEQKGDLVLAARARSWLEAREGTPLGTS